MGLFSAAIALAGLGETLNQFLEHVFPEQMFSYERN